jgi:hypothetical protein
VGSVPGGAPPKRFAWDRADVPHPATLLVSRLLWWFIAMPLDARRRSDPEVVAACASDAARPLAAVCSPPERSAFVGESASPRCRAEALRRGRGLLVASYGLVKLALCLPRRRVPGGAVWSGAWRPAPGGAFGRVDPARRGQPVPAWGLLRRIRCTEVRRVRRPLGSSLRMQGVALRPGFALATSRRRDVGTGRGVVSPDAVCAARL